MVRHCNKNRYDCGVQVYSKKARKKASSDSVQLMTVS